MSAIEPRIRLHVEGDSDRAAFARIAPPGVEVAPKPRRTDEGGKDAMLKRAAVELSAGISVIVARDFDDLDADGVREWAASGLGATSCDPITERAWGMHAGSHRAAILGVGLHGDPALLAFGLERTMLDDYVVRLLISEDGWERTRAKHGWRAVHATMRLALDEAVDVVRRHDLGMQASKRLHLLIRALVDEDVRPATLIERLLAAHDALEHAVFAPVNADLAACSAWLRA